MTQFTHTSGPIEAGRNGELFSASRHQSIAMVLQSEDGEGNARLLAAAYNAFDSAAKALNLNAVEMAERMGDGDLAEMFNILESIISAADMPTKTVDDIDRQIKAEILNENRARAIVAKVKGDAT